MKKPRYLSASGLSCHGLLWLASKLKTSISYGLLASLILSNSTAPALAQQLKKPLGQTPSTSPNPVAPQPTFRTLQTPSCSNSINFSEYPTDTAITNQYSNKGIVFGGSSPFITNDGANPTSPVLSGSPQFVGAIEGSFVDPKDGVTPATAVSLQLDAGYFNQHW